MKKLPRWVVLCCLLPCCVPGCDPPPAPARKLNLAHSTSFVVYPADTNHMGTLFGGKLLAEFDRTAGIAVRRLLYASRCGRAVTAGAEAVRFLQPASVGDLILVNARVTRLGERSVTVELEAVRETRDSSVKVADAVFTFVAVDPATGKAAGHGLSLGG